MISSFWLDIVLLAILVITGVLILLLYSNRAATVSVDKLIDRPNPDIPGPRCYPHNLVRQCGLSPGDTVMLYWAIKCASVVLVGVLLLEVSPRAVPLYLYPLSAIPAFFACDLWLLWQRKKRRQQISSSLEFFLGLMIVNLNSGFSLNQAFRKAAQYGLHQANPLAEEVALISRELDAGRARQLAFTRLAQRTGVESVHRLATVVNVGLEMGTPMIDALQSQAKILRMQRKQQDTARINRKTMETMLPVLLTCFPMFLMLVLFPAGIQILNVLELLGDIF
ncbi:type II secretion system F family protein [Pseudomaricurvus alcaniphilus]|uniref:type II secretion system F family protein n=1 Tax=Pseudomaricurvus alcaniphilus TaxID=1166482 RepID=UPI00140C422F|nr:type II secretion system F family protein [Pseudomaricurvus alcaniphilus]